MCELLNFDLALQALSACAVTASGGLFAASLIRRHYERNPFITLFGSNAEVGSPPVPSHLPDNRMVGASQVELFDSRPYQFQLRWDPEIGTYAERARSREQNKVFRGRVYSEFRRYVEYGLDTLALCDLVRKSVAFTEYERAEIIADLVKNQ